MWPEEFIFPPEAFRRQDESDDADFYSMPRPATTLTQGLRGPSQIRALENIKPGSAVLDICSSWCRTTRPISGYDESHSGTGMNAPELEQNAQLNDSEPKNLNVDPTLPYADASFDAVTCVVSVDYLNKPLDVFKEVCRVLAVASSSSQSNRCFPSR